MIYLILSDLIGTKRDGPSREIRTMVIKLILRESTKIYKFMEASGASESKEYTTSRPVVEEIDEDSTITKDDFDPKFISTVDGYHISLD